MDELQVQITSRRNARGRRPILGTVLLIVSAVLVLVALFFAPLSRSGASTIATTAALVWAVGGVALPAALVDLVSKEPQLEWHALSLTSRSEKNR